MVNLLEPDWKCTFHCCLPGPHQHEQFIQIYLRAIKSAAKTLSSFCTAGKPQAVPLILSDKLWNILQKDTLVDTHLSHRSKHKFVYPAVQIPFPPHSYEENRDGDAGVIVRLLSGLVSKLLELFDAPHFWWRFSKIWPDWNHSFETHTYRVV